MELWEQAYEDYLNGMKYQEIADKYNVTINTVKSWKTRHWNNKKCAHKSKKSVHTKPKKVCTQKQGAPKGNKNAVGNSGGAPVGSQNALKHGGYSKSKLALLDKDEKSVVDDVPTDEETLLLNNIRELELKEYRLLKAIKKCRDANGGLMVKGVLVNFTKREFDSDTDKKIYDERKQKKIKSGEQTPGYDKFTQTTTESTMDTILRLERELTSTLRAKTQCVSQLNKIRESKSESKSNSLAEDWIAALTGEEVENG